MRYFLYIITFLFSTPVLAVDFRIPLNCKYGEDCFIEYYFDHNKEPEKWNDYSCGHITKDKNSSTDFKLKNYAQMKKGVEVVAADDGIVQYVRDGVTDINVNLIGVESVRGRECGNGVIIKHKRGYISQYCHLKEGSIEVKKNEAVEKGQKIAQVGLSGATSFPHLQFSVVKDGRPIDPFTGEDPTTGDNHVTCGSLDIYPLWDRESERYLRYISTALLSSGFTSRVPHADGAREGKFGKKNIKDNSKFLVFWVDIFGIENNDKLLLTIIGPDGEEIISEEKTFNSYKSHHFEFVGKKPESKKTWPLGTYTGKVKLTRSDLATKNVVIEYSQNIDVVKKDKK